MEPSKTPNLNQSKLGIINIFGITKEQLRNIKERIKNNIEILFDSMRRYNAAIKEINENVIPKFFSELTSTMI